MCESEQVYARVKQHGFCYEHWKAVQPHRVGRAVLKGQQDHLEWYAREVRRLIAKRDDLRAQIEAKEREQRRQDIRAWFEQLPAWKRLAARILGMNRLEDGK